MSFPQIGITSTPTQKKTAVSGTVAKEGFTNEVSFSNGGTANKMLFYKFAPKGTGEYRITAEIKSNAATTMSVLVVFPNRTFVNGSNYADVVGIPDNAINFNTPIGTVYPSTFTTTKVGNLPLLTTSSTTYVNVEGFLTVPSLVPIFFYLSSSTTTTIFIQNFNIYYDLR